MNVSRELAAMFTEHLPFDEFRARYRKLGSDLLADRSIPALFIQLHLDLVNQWVDRRLALLAIEHRAVFMDRINEVQYLEPALFEAASSEREFLLLVAASRSESEFLKCAVEDPRFDDELLDISDPADFEVPLLKAMMTADRPIEWIQHDSAIESLVEFLRLVADGIEVFTAADLSGVKFVDENSYPAKYWRQSVGKLAAVLG